MRGSYSLNRAGGVSGRLSLPFPIPRTLVLFAAIFAFGAAIGWVATRPFVGGSSVGATSNDYVAVVAQLYARDHNLTLARERLSRFGTPSALVAAASNPSAAPRVPDDLAALQSLAQALNADQSPTASATVANAGAPSWIGPVVAFIVALLLGTIVLLRTAGLSLPRLALPAGPARSPRPIDREDATSLHRSAGAVAAEPPPSRRPLRDRVSRDGPVDPSSAEVAPVSSAGVARRAEPARTATRLRPRARRLTFESCYRLGDDPFDEIHPIIDPVSGTLVAACGLNASLKTGDGRDGAGYFAFAAWIQDYVNGETLNAVGLVTRPALQAERERVEAWIERGQIDSVLVGDRGLATELSASDLNAKITVLEASVVDRATGSYFDGLTVRFEVLPKGNDVTSERSDK